MAAIKIRRRFKKQKTDAIKLRITDQGLVNQSVKLTGLSLEYLVKRGLVKIPSN